MKKSDNLNTDWYFTAPWDPVSIRRGDALGFRAGADYFADLLAPGLSNSTSDARWISILSWCLQWSHVAWQNTAGRDFTRPEVQRARDLTRQEVQRARYAWLRPLELLWVDRTLESGQTTGQIRGVRSIKRWREADRQLPNFAMSPDQFRRYRQVGMYGAYRVVFRAIPNLTNGDGWTLDETGMALANLVNKKLPPAARLKHERFESGTKWGRWTDDEARYWVKQGWPTALVNATSGLLPTPGDSIAQQLPDEERRLLKPVLFSADSTRHVTAAVLANAKNAKTHADLCDALARSNEFDKETKEKLAPLPAFTRFADAAMEVMRDIWREINQNDNEQSVALSVLVQSIDSEKLKSLSDASENWLNATKKSHFRNKNIVDELANTIIKAKTPIAQLKALAKHHHDYGGGRRWFIDQNGKFVPQVADTGIAASDYRFRLRSLCRLAAQCGVADMSVASRILESQQVDDEEDAL